MYHMKIAFSVDISMERMNTLTEKIDGSRLIAENAMTVYIEQTVPFVPTNEILQQYASTIKSSDISETKLRIEDVRFSHYEIFEEIKD